MAAVFDRLPEWHVGRYDVTGIAKETLDEVGKDQTTTLAAAMTYHTVLAIFPFLLLLAGLTSIIDTLFNVPDLTDRIIEQASEAMPEDATSVLEGFVREVVAGRGGAAIGFGLIGSLWAASAAVSTAIKAMNSTYDVEEDRGFLMNKVTALVLTIVFSMLILTGTVLIVMGAGLAEGVGEWLGWNQAVIVLWNIAMPVLALLMVAAAVVILYKFGPNTNITLGSVVPGTLLFLVTWIIFSLVFAFYISNFGSYNRVYGSLAAVIILLLWLYWSNTLLLIGAELNAVIARRFDPEYQADSRNRNQSQVAA